MNYRGFKIRKTYTFHQWKGEGYAVFASLGKLIRIGKLATAISQNFYSKDVSQPAVLLKCSADSSLEENADEMKSPDLVSLLQQLAGFQLSVITSSKSNIHPAEELPFWGWNELIICLIRVRFLLRAGNGFLISTNHDVY